MSGLFTTFRLKQFTLRNRIVFPPIVCFGFSDESGVVTDRNVSHYSERSEDGAGIVITEATCIRKEGRAAPGQLGIWSDDHINGLSRISSTVKGNGAVSIIQLHHAGLMSPEPVALNVKGPSADVANPRWEALTIEEIAGLEEDYINAAIRARRSGFDGVEIHGAHGYLLGQFASSFWNKRSDIYGGSHENRLRMALNIIHGIRQACGEEFLIGYRLGANAPMLEDGVIYAGMLENAGIDYLHVSHGGSLQNLPRPPKDFDYNWIVYSGVTIKTHVRIPVIVVNDIRTEPRAGYLIENGLADLVAMGRPILADPYFIRHIRNNETVNECLSCKLKCRWYESADLCPAHRRMESRR